MNYLLTGMISLFLLYSLSSCAQGKYGIKTIHAFSTERMPGNIPVQEEGVPVKMGADTLYVIYIETKGTTANWDTAWMNDKVYLIQSSIVKDERIEVGIQKENGERIVLRNGTENQLWVLYLQETSSSQTIPRSIKQGEILLSGNYQGKKVFQVISKQVELAAFPSV